MSFIEYLHVNRCVVTVMHLNHLYLFNTPSCLVIGSDLIFCVGNNTVEPCDNTNHFEIPRQYHTNTNSYRHSDNPLNMNFI